MRFMRVDSLIDGKEVVLDRKTHTVLPRAHFDVLEPNVQPDGSLPPIKNPLDIEEVDLQQVKETLQRTRELLKGLKASPTPELTVGDLSFVTAEKRRRSLADEMRKFDDWKRGLSVGDLSCVTRKKYADKYE